MVVYSPIAIFIGFMILFCVTKQLAKRSQSCRSMGPLRGVAIVIAVLLFLRFATQIKMHPAQPEISKAQTSSVNVQSPPQDLNVVIGNDVNNMVSTDIDKAHNLMPARSDILQAESSLCATTADADNEARNAAGDLLFPHVKAAIELKTASSAMLRVVATDDWLKKQIKSSLARNVDISNRHVDRIERPYGVLWKESIDVDASSRAIQNNFIAPFTQLAEAQASGKQTEWLSAAGLIGVIFLLYVFLNSATKGYFVWRLRAVAALALIATALAIFQWLA